jgi:DinB family protein
MANLDSVLIANREAVNELAAASEQCAGVWTTPRAPGKWSPSQLVEHVARAMEESANVISGAPSKLPTLPAFVRPLLRGLIFKRILRTGTFPKGKAPKAMDPVSGPATPVEGRRRLEEALARFDRECRACAQASGIVSSGAFGRISIDDYARFVELHTRHHRRQMPAAASVG